MSIESFGAVVSDNDGSAFITKAEFDSLKNNFQSQIDQYNTSIDSKIDGAIASYLAGIRLSTDPEVLLDRVANGIGHQLRFYKGFEVGTPIVTQYQVQKEKAMSLSYSNSNEASGYEQKPSQTDWYNNWNNYYYREIVIDPYSNSNSTVVTFWLDDNKIGSLSTNRGDATIVFPDNNPTTSKAFKYQWLNDSDLTPTDWTDKTNSGSVSVRPTYNWRYLHIKFSSEDWKPQAFAVWSMSTAYSQNLTIYQEFNNSKAYFIGNGYQLKAATARQVHYGLANSYTKAGSGSVWCKTNLPDGNKQLLGYRKQYPLVILDYSSKWYKDYGSVDPSDNTFNNTTNHSHTLSWPVKWGITQGGTHYTSYNTSNNTWWYRLVITLFTEDMQTTNVQTDQWGSGTETNLRYVDLYAQPSTQTETNIATNFSYSSSTHTIEGYSATIGAVNISLNPSGHGIYLPSSTAPMSSFENIYLSAVAGETVWMGGGAPLLYIQSSDDTEYKVTMNIKLYNASGNPTSGTCYVKLSKKQFSNGLITNTGDAIYEGEKTCNSSGEATIVIDNITGLPKGSNVWYNLAPYTNGYYAVCTDCQVQVK